MPNFEVEAGYRGASQLLEQPDRPTAIFAASDTLALGAVKAIRGRGIRVPDDIAVVGYDDIDVAAIVEPPLTTVALPAHEMGDQSMTMLRQLIAGQALETRHLVLPTHLVPRQSCGCSAGVDRTSNTPSVP